MKIYFTASIVGKKDNLTNYLKIIRLLKSKNHQVISDHIIKSSEDKVNMQTTEERERFHRKLNHWIQDSQCMIAEVTFPSISVGFEISLALNLGKPVLILYTNDNSPSLLQAYINDKLICEKYSANDLNKIISLFLNYVDGHIDTRFTFFITPTIASFLEKISLRKKIPRSVYLRKLIEKEMKTNM